jgi:hypothetical protein
MARDESSSEETEGEGDFDLRVPLRRWCSICLNLAVARAC